MTKLYSKVSIEAFGNIKADVKTNKDGEIKSVSSNWVESSVNFKANQEVTVNDEVLNWGTVKGLLDKGLIINQGKITTAKKETTVKPEVKKVEEPATL